MSAFHCCLLGCLFYPLLQSLAPSNFHHGLRGFEWRSRCGKCTHNIAKGSNAVGEAEWPVLVPPARTTFPIPYFRFPAVPCIRSLQPGPDSPVPSLDSNPREKYVAALAEVKAQYLTPETLQQACTIEDRPFLYAVLRASNVPLDLDALRRQQEQARE
ncbi:hypothetical protein DFH06DRAFT_1302487 [Mycena polygramma]|nr:hypothetical protein DFH06DRAFT_1302487 [Mycena polygramma]